MLVSMYHILQKTLAHVGKDLRQVSLQGAPSGSNLHTLCMSTDTLLWGANIGTGEM